MANTLPQFVNASSLDFQAQKASLKAFLKAQPIFRDYNFDGSNLSVLLDVLAYNSVHNNLYLNMVGSEMWLDSSILRASLVSHAKELNYTPRSRTSAVIALDVQVVIPANTALPPNIVIPANYKVSGRASNGQVFSFYTQAAVTVGSSNNYTAIGLPFYEGNIINETFVANSTLRAVLSSANVDVSSITVNVQNSNTDTTNTNFVHESSIFGVASTTPAFFVQGYQDFNYEVTFGNGVVGQALVNGNIIRVGYRQTTGDQANGVKLFTADQNISGFSAVATISNTNLFASGGAMAESNNEIRTNAPLYFATQGRAVTASDFVTLLKTNFPFLSAVTAYGGELATPKQYGKVLIAGIPRGGSVLSDSQKTQILAFMRDKAPLSIDPLIVDPDTFNVKVNTLIQYNPSLTSSTSPQLIQTILAAINTFSSANLGQFGSDLRYSKFLRAIDDADASFISNDTHVLIAKKLYPVPYTTSSYSFSFGTALDTTAKPSTITSSQFGYQVGAIVYQSFIEDDGSGTLRVYTTSSAGVKVILLASLGSVNYTTGLVTMSLLTVSSIVGNSLNIYGKTASADITTDNNKILIIDASDVSIDVLAVLQ
jgi:hypothetical protein